MISVKNSFEIAYNGTENECRFELYADTASDLQGLTHIDGIKIQMGSECTDIATGDKYILNGSGAWILQPSDCAFSNVYTKAEIDNMSNVIYQTMLYYHTAQESSDGSITFYTIGTPVSSLTIYGNGQQTGTPTPDNPVMPEFVGVRTANLWNEEYPNISGILQYVSVYVGNGEVTISTTCGRSGTAAVLFLLAGSVSTGASTNDNGVWNGNDRTVSAVDGYVTVAFRAYSTVNPNNAETMLNLGSTALPYEPYGWAEKITCAGQTVPVYLGQTQTVRRVKKLVLTGEEDWTRETGNTYYITIPMPVSDYTNAMCTHYPIATSYSALTSTDLTFTISRRPSAFIHDNRFSDWNALKSYLAAQYAAGTPVTVWYVLNTPETGIVNEPLAKIGDYADELHSTDTGVTIPTVSGENTLTVDTDLIPSKIVISGGE